MNPSPLKGRSCLLMADLSTPEIRYLLDLAKEVKHQKRLGLVTQRFQGKTLAMIFENPPRAREPPSKLPSPKRAAIRSSFRRTTSSWATRKVWKTPLGC